VAITILRQVRSTRDLRAQILSLAADLATNTFKGHLKLIDPVISDSTVQDEWERLLPVIIPEIRERMSLSIESNASSGEKSSALQSGLIALDRPNYRYEVLRLLIGASLEDDGPQPRQGLMEKIGASQTPITQALSELKRAGVAHSSGRGVEVRAEDVSSELIAKIQAQPQTLRFRFERGAQIKPPATLLQRALSLALSGASAGWKALSLSGTPVALADVPKLDLIGTPRLDLVAHVPRDAKSFDSKILRLLDDGLEPEPNVLAPAPVVVTLVRAETEFTRDAGLDHARCAYPMDVFLSLLDLGLREQAQQYAKAVRP
jgi:hypothetical protein